MKKYEERIDNSPRKYKVLLERCCDLCGFKAKSEDWGSSRYNVNETDIQVTCKQKDGNSWPEGGSGYEYEIDLCPSCFKNKLVPWLQSQGANIQQIDWDW